MRRFACVAILGAMFAIIGAASASAADPVIAAAGDIACSASSSNYNGGNGTADKCRQKYTSDLLVNAGLSAVLILGDMQYESASLSGINNSYNPTWGRVKSITRPAPGNHEYKTSGAAGYFDYFNGTGVATGPAGDRSKGYYSFNVGTWHLIALNSTDHCTIVPCSAGSAQEVWLKADLAANADKYCTLAFWHDPRFNSGHDSNADEMKPLFQALYDANADVVLGGHAHDYERFAPQNPSGGLDNARGIRQFVVGTGGAFWTSVSTPKPNSEVRQNNTYGVLKMTLKPTGYDYQFVPEAGKTWTDSGSGTCHGGTPPPADTTKPTIPGNLTASAASPSRVNLAWSASSDNVGVTGYTIYRNSAQIATVGAVTSFADTSVTGGTTYTYQVRANDAAGNASDPSNSASATTPAGGSVTFAPEADTRVQSSAATTNYATSFLRVDGSSGVATVESLLRFTVSGVTAGTIESAKLRVHAYSGTADGPAVFTTNPAWTETAVTWNSRPPRTSALTDDKGAIATNSWAEYDVTPFVTSNGTYSFGLTGTSTDGVDIYSRENATLRPELVVTTGATDTQKPTPPGNLTATGGAGQVSLGWQQSSDNVGVTGYRVFRGATQIASLGAAATSHTDTGLAAGSYSYTVRAVDAAGNVSDPSNTASANVPDTTKPSPPGSLTATPGTGQVALSWQGSTDNVGVTGYRVFRGTTEIASLGSAARSHTDAGLAAGPYSYTVRAIDAASNLSDPSNTANATVPDTTKPTMPGNLTASSTASSSANLSWQGSTDNVGVTGYRIYRDSAQIGSTGAGATTYSDTTVSATVTYRYVVRAVDAAGNLSDPSNEASVTVPDTVKPTAPGNLHTTAVTISQVDLAWNGSSDNVGVTGYRVFRDDVPINDVGATTTSYSDGPIAPGEYRYTVRARDAAGNLSDPSNEVTVTVRDTEPPTAPLNLDAEPAGTFQVELTWGGSHDNVDVIGYEIYRDDVKIDTVGPVTSYTDNVLAPAVYTYYVRAMDASGNFSDPSNTDTVTMLPPDLENPSIPGNLFATLNGASQVDLNWEESQDNVLVTAYRVYRNDVLIATIDPATSYSDTGVSPRDHEYVVRAEDAAGNLSDPSNPASVVVPDAESPTAPGNLAASAVEGGPVLLGWDAASDNIGIAAYEVYRDGQLVDTIEPVTSYTDAVGPGTYAYHLRALDPTGNTSDVSNTADIEVLVPDTENPGPPGNLGAQADAAKVDLEWDAATDNRAVTAYEIRRDGGLVATVGAVTAWSDHNVTAPLTYEYDVRALDAAGNVSDPSNTASATVPDTEKPTTPANLSATATASQVDLTWDASGDNVAVTGYWVYRDGQLTATVGAVTSYSDTSVTAPGYDYEIRAFDAAGNLSDPSNQATATVPDAQKPTAPGTLTANAAGPNRVDLSWGASGDNIGVTGYTVYRDTTLIATIGAVTSFADTGVAGSTTYAYQVRARDAAGNVSDPSNTASATTPAASATFTFSPEADARTESSAATTNYATSFLRVDGSSSVTTVESLLRFTVSGAPAGSIRSAKLRVYAYSGTVDGPAVFTTNPAWSETAVNWNNRPPRTSATTDDKGNIPTNSWVEYDVTSFVTANGTYSFGLTGTSSDGTDIYSREAATLRPELVVTTGAPDTQKPTPPPGLGATVMSASRVDLSWGAAGDNVGVTGYRIFRNDNHIASVGVTTAYSDTAVAANSSYTYQVRAVDAAGNLSDPSNTASATTPAGATVLTLSPEADARTHEASPTTNYGTAYLRSNGGSELDVESFLRFTVTGAPPGSVQSAKLRLYNYNGTADGPALYTTNTSWSETTINWNTRPARTSAASGDKGAIPVNTWVEYDVTPFVTGNGTYSFTLVTTSNDGIDFYNREAATLRPELVVTRG